MFSISHHLIFAEKVLKKNYSNRQKQILKTPIETDYGNKNQSRLTILMLESTKEIEEKESPKYFYYLQCDKN